MNATRIYNNFLRTTKNFIELFNTLLHPSVPNNGLSVSKEVFIKCKKMTAKFSVLSGAA